MYVEDGGDIDSYIIDLKSSKVYPINKKGIEEDRAEDLDIMIKFLCDARPYDVDFKVDELDSDSLMYKFPEDDRFYSWTSISDLEEILIVEDAICFIFKETSKSGSYIDSLFITNKREVVA